MISKKLEKAVNEQIQKETYSAYLYLAMAAYFAAQNLDGFANWFYVQNQEETYHAMKLHRYLIERGGEVELMEIEKPPKDFESPLKAFRAALEHERFITKSINELYQKAIDEQDPALASFLKWYVDEQVEEEASAEKIIAQLELIEGYKPGLYHLDKELAARVYTPPAEEAEE
ncbi:MAG: ferritin [Fimbriimonadales bacterium]